MNPAEFMRRQKLFATETRKGGLFDPVQQLYWWHGCQVLVDRNLPDGILEIRPKFRRII